MMKYKIGVIGSTSGYDSSVSMLARDVGREVANHDCILLTGGTTGVSYEAVIEAKENSGFTIGISPAANLGEHVEKYKLPTDYFDVLIFTGLGYKGRNIAFIRSCDAVVVISGRIGTLNEFTIAYDEKKAIGFLAGSGGLCDDEGVKEFIGKSGKEGGKIVSSHDPRLLIKELLKILR